MSEKFEDLRDWVEDHLKLVIIVGVILILVIAMFTIRGINMKKKAQAALEQQQVTTTVSDNTGIQQDTVEEPIPTSSYQAQLGLTAEKDDRVNIEEKEPVVEVTPEPEQTEPNFPVAIDVWDFREVPNKAVDGSSFKNYLSKVKLNDFGTFWGTELTEDDFFSQKRYLCGVFQNPDKYIQYIDLMSSAWVMDNIEEFNPNDCITFTNLHVIGSLSDSHVAVLCATDWYSAYGMKDMLVMFEDISGTLKVGDLKAGDIFSCVIYAHNMKVVEVNGKRVLVIEYATF